MKKNVIMGIIAVALVIVVSISVMNITGNVVFDDRELNRDLVAYYSFEGNVEDLIGDNNGLIDGNPSLVPGKVGQAYSFDGVDDFIGVGTPEEMRGPVTFSAWIKRETASKGGVIYERGGIDSGYQVYSDKDGRISIRYRWDRGDVSYQICKDGLDIDDESWHFVTAVLDIEWNQITLYIDGSEECNDRIIPITKNVEQASHIGSHGAEAVQLEGYFDGEIDEIGIWNRRIGEKEVMQLYESYSA